MERSAVKQPEKVFILDNTVPCRDHPSFSRVVIKSGKITQVNQLVSRYDRKVKQVHYYGPLADLERSSWDKNRLLTKIFPQNKKEIIQHSKLLQEKKILVCPRFPLTKIEDITFIVSMGISLDLLYVIDRIDFQLVLKILQLYLFDPLLRVPIEPFHSILISKLRKTRLNLWMLNLLFPPIFYYADEIGISEDQDNLRDRNYLYLIDWEERKLKRTGRKNRIKHYFKSMPRENPGCLSCFHLDLCFGWGRYNKETCLMWKEILGTLETNVNQMRQAFNKYP